MNKNLYQLVIDCIMQLNDFISTMDEKIRQTQENYDSRKRQMNEEHKKSLAKFDDDCNSQIQILEKNKKSMIMEAEQIKSKIQKIDEHLSSIDKYYVKTKIKKLEELKHKKSDEYQDPNDYFEALKAIQKQYSDISSKYTKDILPSIINHLNYIFSAKRKSDYEELIILHNTVDDFIENLKSELDELTISSKDDLTEKQKKSREELLTNQREFREKQEILYEDSMAKLDDEIETKLEEIIPDNLINTLFNYIEEYKQCYNKVNNQDKIINDIFYMGYVDFPLKDFVVSTTLYAYIEKKCQKLMVDDVIKFPIIIAKNTPSTIMIKKSKTATPFVIENLIQGMMYCYLTTVPVGKLRFSVIDCENHGNSVEAYFDAKKIIPNLFDEKIYTTSDLVDEKIKKLNEKIEYINQNLLGSKYDNILDYSKDHPDYKLEIELLTIFDFEISIDSHYMSYLKNIITSGGRCGIYLIIAADLDLSGDNYSQIYVQTIQNIQKKCITIEQINEDFNYLGLNYHSTLMPSKSEFNQYIYKYSLIVAGIQNKGIALPKFVKNLLDIKEDQKLDEELSKIKEVLEKTNKDLVSNLNEEMNFPTNILVGKVDYPKDIFSEAYGYQKIYDAFKTNDDKIRLPFLLELSNNSNFVIEYDSDKETMAKDFIIHMTWQFLANIPVTKANICIIDPDKKGSSVLPFLDFRKESPLVFDNNIYTNNSDITQRLEKFNNYIDDMIQNKLGNKYETLLDYNLKTPNKMEVATLLTIYDFPVGFDDKNINFLENILKNGCKCGVYTIISYNQNVDLNSNTRRILENNSTRFSCKDENYLMLPFNLNVSLTKKLSYSAISEFVKKYQELDNIIRGKGISFEDILEKELFQGDCSKVLAIPVGVGDEEKIIPVTFGQGSSHHALVAGAIGSGKSTLLHTLIMSAMLHYSPDKLNLYLMDFKGGTEFKIYDSYRLPHIKLLALDAMQEFGESILESLVKELEIRSQKFKSANVSNLSGYIKVTNTPMAKILVIMDEFQILFNDSTNRKVANNCAELVKRIVTEGRSYGIHLLMATQSTKIISELTLATGTIEQMRIRIGLKCGEYDTNYLFGDKNFQKINDMMKGPIGTAVLNEEYTEENPIGVRIAYCDDATKKKYLEIIQEKFRDYEYDMQSFENSKVIELLDVLKPKWQSGNPKVLVGNLIKVAPDLCITYDKRKRHNTLICGSNDKMIQNVLNTYLLSFLLNKDVKVFCIDGDIISGEEDINYQNYSKFGSRFKLALDRKDILKMINEMYDLYIENKKNNGKNQVFLVIDKLQYLDLVIKLLYGDKINEEEFLTEEAEKFQEVVDDDPFDFTSLLAADNNTKKSNKNIAKKVAELIDEGFGYGFSFIITCNELQTIKEALYFGNNHLVKFPDRYVFSLNNDDANYLIDGISLSSLPDNIIYYTDSVQNTCQIKPFKFPDAEQLNVFINKLLRDESNG